MPFLVAFAPLAPGADSLSPSHPTPAWERASSVPYRHASLPPFLRSQNR